MKKLLFLFTMLSLLVSCSDDDDNNDKSPIKGLEIPPSTTPVKPGETVTIKGAGFTEVSEIWFRAIATRAEDREDVKATVTKVNANGITFIAPEVYGNQSVLLKENGKEYDLGEMTFEEEPEEVEEVKILPKKVKEIREYEDGSTDYTSYQFVYDGQDRIQKMTVLYSANNSEIYTYEYKDNEITCKSLIVSSGGKEQFDEIVELDAKGRTKSYKWVMTNDPKVYEESIPTYNGDYLKQLKTSGVNDEDYIPYHYTENWTFIAGNLVHYDYEYDDESEGYGSIDCKYENTLNNLNIDLWGAIFGHSYYEGDLQTDFLQPNITGKRSRQLPAKVTDIEGDDDPDDTNRDVEEYTYEFSGEYITKITRKIVETNDEDLTGGYYEIFYEE